MPCRRCSVCEDMAHHWLEDIDEADPPTYVYVCKHCDAVGDMCPECMDEDGEHDCEVCHGTTVIYLGDMPPCAWCEQRTRTPLDATIDMTRFHFCSEECRSARVFGHHER